MYLRWSYFSVCVKRYDTLPFFFPDHDVLHTFTPPSHLTRGRRSHRRTSVFHHTSSYSGRRSGASLESELILRSERIEETAFVCVRVHVCVTFNLFSSRPSDCFISTSVIYIEKSEPRRISSLLGRLLYEALQLTTSCWRFINTLLVISNKKKNKPTLFLRTSTMIRPSYEQPDTIQRPSVKCLQSDERANKLWDRIRRRPENYSEEKTKLFGQMRSVYGLLSYSYDES